MLDNNGFDLWSGDYDKSVNISDESNSYPFAGYKNLMNSIYGAVMKNSPVKVLDIGIGTGTLSSKLYSQGNEITGIDFSNEMLNTVKAKMPNALLIQHDFSEGLPKDLINKKYDFIISTYALHHLTDAEKMIFIPSLLDFLDEGGSIIIGDVSFYTRSDLEKCRLSCVDGEWDDDEFYFVFSEISQSIGNKCLLTYQQFSHCSGVMIVRHNK